MKRTISPVLIGLLVIFPLSFQSVSPQKRQGQRVGNIGGIVEERNQDDGDRSVAAEFKSEVPINKVEWKLPGNLLNVVKTNFLPENWVMKKDENRLSITGPPRFDLNVLFEFPKSSDSALDKFLKKPVEYNFSFGTINYGPYNFVVKHTDPIKPVKPGEAAQIPEVIRPGSAFLITPNNGYTQGTWKLGIGGNFYEEYLEDIQPDKLERHLALLRENRQEFLDRMKNTITAMYGINSTITARLPELLNQEGENTRVFYIPKGISMLDDVNFLYQNQFGETLVNGTANTKLLPEIPDKFPLAPPRLINCSPKVFQGDKICVCGFFPNLFSQRQLLLDGRELGLPLSGSTDMVTFLPENLTPGRHVITWDVPAFEHWLNPEPQRTKPSAAEQVEFIVLGVQASIDKNALFTGEGTYMHMKIIGTEEKIEIKLENKTPSIIEFEGGVLQIISTSGGADNRLKRHVKGIHKGDFDIQYTLTLPSCPCNPEQTIRNIQTAADVKSDPAKETAPGNQTADKPKPCEQTLSACKELADQLVKLQSNFEYWDKIALETSNRAEDHEDTAFTDSERANSLRLLDEVRRKLAACLDIYDNCTKGGQGEGTSGTSDVSSPPSDLDKKPLKFEKPEECEAIDKECDKLWQTLSRLIGAYNQELDGCNKYSSDKTRVETCKEIADASFKRRIEILELKFKECRARGVVCREGFGLPPRQRNPE